MKDENGRESIAKSASFFGVGLIESFRSHEVGSAFRCKMQKWNWIKAISPSDLFWNDRKMDIPFKWLPYAQNDSMKQ